MESQDDYGITTRLEDGILLDQLVKNFSSEFTISIPDEAEQFNPNLNDNFDTELNYDLLGENVSLLDCPFDDLKKTMEPITGDKKILKSILKLGNGVNIVPNNVVYYHYSSYLDLEPSPFDSSFLRSDKLVRSQIGVDPMYSGFQISILSMKLGEKSRFLVDPDYAFGKYGVPPRIPQNATILLEIEIFKVVDCGDAIESTANPTDFAECYKTAKAFHLLGNDRFSFKDIQGAISNYRKAERALIRSKMQNEEEEEKFKKLLFKIFLNMCVCYNHPKLNAPEKVCSISKENFYYCLDLCKKSSKYYYNLGKAKLVLNDFNGAKLNLKKSLALEPKNKETSDLLLQYEEKKNKYYEHEKITYQKSFFGNKTVISNEAVKKEVEAGEFEIILREELQKFASSPNNRLQLPNGVTNYEKRICKKLSDEFGFTFDERMICGKVTLTILK